MKELITIQANLNAPKNQKNNFGGYMYRSAEDILEAVKPLLDANECTLTLSDDIVMIGDRFYIKVTATIKNSTGEIESVTALAREETTRKGMSGEQLTGSASSYARKHALGGLFCIDDNKDSDAMLDPTKESIIKQIKRAENKVELVQIYNDNLDYAKDTDVMRAFTERKKQLENGADKK